MAYVDADKFAEEICNFPAIDDDSANAVISLLRRQPTADVEEVVRCSKCKNAKKTTVFRTDCAIKCELLNKTMFDSDFCSYGERREK